MTKITPHKGGRTEAVYFRITPEMKQNLQELASTNNQSVADWIEAQIKENTMLGSRVVVRKDGGGFVDWGNGWSDPFESRGADAANLFPRPMDEQRLTYPIEDPLTLERLAIHGTRLDYD